MCGVPLTNSQTFYQFSCQSSSTCISECGPPSWACSCLFCAHGSVYTCTLHTDFDWTVVFPLWPLGASHPSREHHTHTHNTPYTTQSQMLSSGSPTKKHKKCCTLYTILTLDMTIWEARFLRNNFEIIWKVIKMSQSRRENATSLMF